MGDNGFEYKWVVMWGYGVLEILIINKFYQLCMMIFCLCKKLIIGEVLFWFF